MNKPNHPTRSTNRARAERFFHLRDMGMVYSNGRVVRDVTAFSRRDPDGRTYVSFAECDDRDQFSRARGRAIARRKWFNGKRVEIKTDADSVTFDTVVAVYTTV